MFCSPRETVKLLPPCDNLGGIFVGIMPLDRDLLPDPPGRKMEIVRGVVGGAAETDERRVLPARHARMCRGLEQVARQEQKLQEIDGQGRLSCPCPLNRPVEPYCALRRQIIAGGLHCPDFNTAPPGIIRLGGAVCISGLFRPAPVARVLWTKGSGR